MISLIKLTKLWTHTFTCKISGNFTDAIGEEEGEDPYACLGFCVWV